MYEIKKVFPSSLAKYCSIVVALIVFIFGLINFVLNLAGIGIYSEIPWDQQLISLFVSVLFFYVFFWIIGYIFALIYNSIASKSKGIIIEFKLIDKALLKNIGTKGLKNRGTEDNKEDDKKEDKFIV